MNGFLLNGANAAGVRVANIGVISQRGISTIHDGTIVNFKFDGIRLTGALVNSWVVKDMQIVGNGEEESMPLPATTRGFSTIRFW